MLKLWKYWWLLRQHPMKRLQKTNMKHIMNVSPSRQLKLICHIPNPLQDLIGTEELGPQLPTPAQPQRRNWTMQETQPYPLTRLKYYRTMPMIIDSLVVLLRLLQTIPHLR
jgi:hypothetical protein